MQIVDGIKMLSWKWSLERLNLFPCLFYEWCWDMGDCLNIMSCLNLRHYYGAVAICAVAVVCDSGGLGCVAGSAVE